MVVGNAAFLAQNGIPATDQGILVAIDGIFAGSIFVADPVRATTKTAVERFARLGLPKW